VKPEGERLVMAWFEAQREGARVRRDWARADALRASIAGLGWRVQDTPDGPQLEPAPAQPQREGVS
jgi:cysteinyl-tRNA synthetase